MKNEGTQDVEADVVLVPEAAPAGSAPQVRGPAPQGPPFPPPLFAWSLGSRQVTTPRAREEAIPDPQRFPTYRTALAVAAGAEKVVSVVVLQAPFGYRAEVRNADGRRLGASPAAPGLDDGIAVALFSRVEAAALPGRLLGMVVTQVQSSRDVPDDAVGLSGLQVVVLDDFDTAALSADQIGALRQFVALGGNLVLGGGAAGQRTVGPLPDELTPLRPSGEGVASLQPLAELAGQTATARVSVVTGDAGGSRVLLASEGLPLVAEVHYGAGRVVQLAYDPLAEPLSSDSSLAAMAWDQGLRRAGFPWGQAVIPYSSALAPQDQLWAPVLEPAPWPRWPPWAPGMLAGYAAVTGLVVYFAGRSPRTRRRPWAAVPVLTVVAVAASVLAGAAGSDTADRQISLDTLGPHGTVLTNTYRTIRQLRPGPVRALGADAATTMFTEAGSVRPILVEEAPAPGAARRGRPGGVLTNTATGVGLPSPGGPWEPFSLQTISIGQRAGGLEAHLRLVGTAEPPAAGVKITGTVTNHGTQPLRQLRAQLPEGAQARLADNLAPGATIKVDAALLWAKRVSARSTEEAPRDDLLTFAAASRAFTRPGQIALIGLGSLTPRTSGQRPARHTTTLTVQPVALEAADQRVAYAGQGELIFSDLATGGRAAVFDLSGPPEPAPRLILYSSPSSRAETSVRAEVYNWQTVTWRPLPTQAEAPEPNSTTHAAAPIGPDEINQGLVRIRGPLPLQAFLTP